MEDVISLQVSLGTLLPPRLLVAILSGQDSVLVYYLCAELQQAYFGDTRFLTLRFYRNLRIIKTRSCRQRACEKRFVPHNASDVPLLKAKSIKD